MSDELVVKRQGNGNTALSNSISEYTTRLREEKRRELRPQDLERQLLGSALHSALASYEEFTKLVDLSEYRALERILTAAMSISPDEFVEEVYKLRGRVQHYIEAVEASLQGRYITK